MCMVCGGVEEEILFNPLQVHESQVIGQVGKGYKYAIEVLNVGRIGIGAQVSVVVVL